MIDFSQAAPSDRETKKCQVCRNFRAEAAGKSEGEMPQGELNLILDTREAPPWHKSRSLGLLAALTPKCVLVLPSTGRSLSEEQEQGQRTARRRLEGLSIPTEDQPDQDGTKHSLTS